MRLPPRWVVAVSFAVAAAILGDSLLYAVLPTHWAAAGLESVALVGVLLSANRFVRLASNPVAGWVMARYGQRGPFLLAVFAAAATTAAYALGLGFAVLLLARALWGVCWSFLRLGGFLAALESSGDIHRGYYLGFFNGVTRFGSFVAVLFGGLLTDLFGFQATVLLFAAVSAAAGLFLLRERPPDAGSHRPVLRDTPQQASADSMATASAAGLVVRTFSLRLWAVYGLVFLHGLAVSGLATATLGLWLLTLYGPTLQVATIALGVATLTGFLLSARFLADFLWGPLAGHLSDRHGRFRFTLVAGAIEVAALVGLAAGGPLATTTLAAVGLFLAATALQAALDATAGDLAPPAERPRVMSWYATALDLGAAVGPLAGYALAPLAGLATLYRGAAGLLLVAGLVYWVALRVPARPAPAQSPR